MPLDINKARGWARIQHAEDDPAIQIAWEAAVRELEERTGWCVDPVARTQRIPFEPSQDESGKRLVLAWRQPVTTATYVDDVNVTTNLTIQTINGLQYFQIPDGLTYPLLVTVNAGTNVLNPLLELALLQRVTQHVQSRGDDTVALSSDYWDRITGMMGKGIG